jgi:glycosyltransferase involved in cell wall biosynthesis
VERESSSVKTVDVIVPCYNYGRYLEGCVRSVLSQEVDVRVIIIDDASSDNTAAIGEQIARADSRVEFRRHEENQGHIQTYNEGLGLVEAEFVVLLSADDLLTPGALRRAIELMEKRPGVGFVYGYPIPVYGELLPTPRSGKGRWKVWDGRDWIERVCAGGRNFINCPEVVMRARVQRKIGYYRRTLPHSGDMEMWLRAASISDVGRLNGVDQAFYRIHKLSMQRTIHEGLLFDLKARRDAFEAALSEETSHVPNCRDLLEMSRRALAMIAVRHVRQARDQGCIGGGGSEFEEICRFAKEIYPDVVGTRQWKRLERENGEHYGMLSVAGCRIRAKLREAKAHWDWRTWRSTGVF